MRPVLEVILSLLAVAGLLSLSWLLFGRLLTPAGNQETVSLVPGTGDGETLEAAGESGHCGLRPEPYGPGYRRRPLYAGAGGGDLQIVRFGRADKKRVKSKSRKMRRCGARQSRTILMNPPESGHK